MRRKPPPPPEALTIEKQTPLPTRSRSLAGVESDTRTNWIAYSDALAEIVSITGSSDAADVFLRQRIFAGLLRVSCDHFTFERHADRKVESVRLPGDTALLADQLLRASSDRFARFRFYSQTGDAMWTDYAGGVHARALGLRIDADGLRALLSKPSRGQGQSANMLPADPAPAQGSRSGGRPSKQLDVLRIFKERLEARLTCVERARERGAIVRGWGKADPPHDDTINLAIGEMHKRLRFENGKVTEDSAREVLAALDIEKQG